MATMLVLQGMQLNPGSQPCTTTITLVWLMNCEEQHVGYSQSGVVAPPELLERLREGNCLEF